MPEKIAQLNTVEDPAWFTRELAKLKHKTLILVVAAFATLGVLVGYYMFADVFGGPFQNVSYAAVSTSGLKIAYETKVPVRTRVEYGTNEFYLNETELTDTFETEHDVSVSGLLPGAKHVFRIVAEDNTGQRYTSPFYQAK